MDYRMLGDILPAVEVRLQAGEAMYTQSGGHGLDERRFYIGLQCERRAYEGTGKDVFRRIPVHGYLYDVSDRDSVIAFASTVPGKILAIDTAKTSLICQKGAFLCAQTTVEINTVLTKKFTAGFFGGEGFILQQIQGSGMAFLEVDGDVVERVLAHQEK